MRKALAILVLFAFLAVTQISAQQSSQSGSQSQDQSQPKAQATQPQTKTDSVAEAARKAREAQKNAPKAGKVFNDDNIGSISGTIAVVGNPAAPPAASNSTAAGQTASTTEKPAASAGDEGSWRSKFADARKKLSQDQAELAIMQRELSQLQLQYYPDPQKALKQSVTNDDVYKKQQAIAEKQKQIQADQQALSGLESDLRKAGGDPAWARE